MDSVTKSDDARAIWFSGVARAVFDAAGTIGDDGIGRIEADPTLDQLSLLAIALDTRLINVRGIGTGYCDTCAGIGTVIEVRWK
jgi:hypothetical protein